MAEDLETDDGLRHRQNIKIKGRDLNNSMDSHTERNSFLFSREQRLLEIREKANAAHEKLMSQLNDDVQGLIGDIVDSASTAHLSDHTESNGSVNFSFAQPVRAEHGIIGKTFKPRSSILTELLDIDHIRTVYNIFVAILIIFSIQTIVYDLLEKGRLVIEFDLMFWAFGNGPMVLWNWVIMFGATLFMYPVFGLWASLRHQNQKSKDIIDSAFLLGYLAYISAFLILPVHFTTEQNLPIASSLVVIVEQVRLMMKSHSFVRENVPKVVSNPEENAAAADFSKYLYFLFAPTLIYRDEYPRTKAINWTFAASNIVQLIGCIFYTYYIFVRFCVPNFGNFNQDHVTLKAFVISSFGCMMPGTLVLLIGFFAVLHSWLNAWAEMLRFADRLFYRDWWNSSSFSRYYRTWNIVVHDWLYAYIYRDSYYLCRYQKKYRWLCMYFTFMLSAFVHEYILSMAFRFFYPVLFVMFGGFGVCFMYLTPKRYERTSNIFMWVMLCSGTGIIVCLYSMEWFARKNCPQVVDSPFTNLFIPHSWFCNGGIVPSLSKADDIKAANSRPENKFDWIQQFMCRTPQSFSNSHSSLASIQLGDGQKSTLFKSSGIITTIDATFYIEDPRDLAIVISSTVGVLLLISITLLLAWRYQQHIRSKRKSAALINSQYVELRKEQRRQRKTGITTSSSLRNLCEGLVATVEKQEQYEHGENDVPTRNETSKSTFKSNNVLLSHSGNSAAFPLTKRSSTACLLNSHKTLSCNLIGSGRICKSTSMLADCPHKTDSDQSKTSSSSDSDFERDGAHQVIKVKRSHSAGAEALVAQDKSPQILFSVCYDDSVASLTVTIISVRNLDSKLNNHKVYVRAYLRPRRQQKQCTQHRPSTDAQFHECFYMEKVTTEDLASSHLMLTLHRVTGDKVLGEVLIQLSALHLENGALSHFMYDMIAEPRIRRKSTSEKMMQFDLGQFLVLLHYQHVANRLKVVAHKANQLPKSDNLPGKPEYYVIINLCSQHSRELIESKSTSLQKCGNPIWNEAFLFSLPSVDLDNHYVEFVIMERRKYKPRDAVIGHVNLGSVNTSKDAIQQWNDCAVPCRLEVAHWHNIFPLIRYNR